ncbi:MAG: hypothetical protein UC749_02055 [Ruminococcus sp.]|jgi:hypothetical protein|nr:hypothetical protein [Ruminococcus sp.]
MQETVSKGKSDNSNGSGYDYSGIECFYDICKMDYQCQINRMDKLNSRSSVIITIFLAVVTFVTSYFNLKAILNCDIKRGVDIFKLIIVFGLLVLGLLFVTAAICKLYSIVTPHYYKSVDTTKFYKNGVIYKDKKTMLTILSADLIECTAYNKDFLNKEFEKYRYVWKNALIGIPCIMGSCLASNLFFMEV